MIVSNTYTYDPIPYLSNFSISVGAENDLPAIFITTNGTTTNMLGFLNNSDMVTIIHAVRDISGVLFVAATIIYIIQSLPSMLDGDVG